MRRLVTRETSAKSMFERCTGARRKGRSRGMFDRPSTVMRPKALATPRMSTRTARYIATCHQRCRSTSAIEPLEQFVDDFVDRPIGGVDEDGVVGRRQRAVVCSLVERL